MEAIAFLIGCLGLAGAGYLVLEITRHTKRIADVLEISHEAEIRGVKAARLIDERNKGFRKAATNLNHDVHHG